MGYDAAGLIVQNSWGTGWANGGFGRISWRVVQLDVWEGETIRGMASASIAPSVSMPTGVRAVVTTASSRTTPYTISWKGQRRNNGRDHSLRRVVPGR